MTAHTPDPGPQGWRPAARRGRWGGPVFAGLGLLAACGCAFPARFPGAGPGAGGRARSYEREIVLSAPAREVSRLAASTENGDLAVEPGSGDQVRIRAKVVCSGPGSRAGLRKWADRVRIEPARDRSRLVVSPAVPEPLPAGVGLAVSLDLAVPPDIALELDTGNGRIAVRGTTGGVRADSGNGDLLLEQVGGSVTAETGSGAIRLKGIAGEVRADTGNGDIVLEAVRGNVSADSGSGRITARDVSGSATARSGNGDLELTGIGGSVRARTASGRVQLRGAARDAEVESGNGDLLLSGIRGRLKAATSSGRIGAADIDGEVEATSGNGDVSLSGVRAAARAGTGSGRVEAAEVSAGEGGLTLHSQNGDVRFSGAAAELDASTGSGTVSAEFSAAPRRARLESGNGDVAVSIPRGAGIDIDASTGNGSVRLPAGAPGRAGAQPVSSWQGRIGAGGGKVVLRTGNGTVRVDQP